jgi:hypothetical protein
MFIKSQKKQVQKDPILQDSTPMTYLKLSEAGNRMVVPRGLGWGGEGDGVKVTKVQNDVTVNSSAL